MKSIFQQKDFNLPAIRSITVACSVMKSILATESGAHILYLMCWGFDTTYNDVCSYFMIFLIYKYM